MERVQLQFRQKLSDDVYHFDIIVISEEDTSYYPEGSIMVNLKTRNHVINYPDIEMGRKMFLEEAFVAAKLIKGLL